ncbi:MAG: ATP synthase F1 subunit gamma, partial [Candidatus Binatia bacterium]
MVSLKVIRKRITSVRNTQQITRAMKMVAAAKLRRAQERVEGARPYAAKLSELLGVVASRAPARRHPLLGRGSDSPPHVVVLSSDRGLCGGYNTNVNKTAERFLESEEGRGARLTICGRRGNDFFKLRENPIDVVHESRAGGLDGALAQEVASDVTRRFVDGEAGSVYLVFSRFRSAVSQEPVVEKILPIHPPGGTGGPPRDFLFEPDVEVLLASLLPRFVSTLVLQAMLEATASEHGSRMTAMD